ncbi:hypothetical protein KIPB_004370 [Kipferlia bialata]|uniref:Kelch-type beta propeller n=1 Tax=Kipferlia bialata TaxID=797122 RepID=A0A391NTI1_9EUKA|nr:hypothetical protein KIPB_004370 [Kipferlia bialata]|eukprot:g4370.t1
MASCRIVSLCLDTREWIVCRNSTLPCVLEPRCCFVLGNTFYLTGNPPNGDFSNILSYDMTTEEWNIVDTGHMGGPSYIRAVVVEETAYLLAVTTGDTKWLWSFRETGVPVCVDECTPGLYTHDMTAIGHHVILLEEVPSEEGEHGLFIYLFSVVSGVWYCFNTHSEWMGADDPILYLCHSREEEVLLLNTSSDPPSLFTATIPLPGGDDYESAGRWNVLDPDHN